MPAYRVVPAPQNGKWEQPSPRETCFNQTDPRGYTAALSHSSLKIGWAQDSWLQCSHTSSCHYWPLTQILLVSNVRIDAISLSPELRVSLSFSYKVFRSGFLDWPAHGSRPCIFVHRRRRAWDLLERGEGKENKHAGSRGRPDQVRVWSLFTYMSLFFFLLLIFFHCSSLSVANLDGYQNCKFVLPTNLSVIPPSNGMRSVNMNLNTTR